MRLARENAQKRLKTASIGLRAHGGAPGLNFRIATRFARGNYHMGSVPEWNNGVRGTVVLEESAL